LQDDIDVTEKTIQSILKYGEIHQLENVIENFRPQMLLFSSELNILKDEIEKSIKANIFTEYFKLQTQVSELLNRITCNEVFCEYAKDKAMRPLSGANDSFEKRNIVDTEEFFNALSSASDTIKDRYEEKKKEEMEDFKVECRKQLKQEFKGQLEQMAQKIEDTEEEVKKEIKFKKQVEDQLEAITDERNRLKTQLGAIKDQYEEEKTKFVKEAKESNRQIFEDSYNTATGQYKVFDKNFCLDIDFENKKIINFMNKVRSSNAVLPDIKLIHIKKSPQSNSDLKEFLFSCFPTHLELFNFN
jgi:chromosome segregation ATPase